MEAFIILIACGVVYGLLWMWQRCDDAWLNFWRRVALSEQMHSDDGKE